jgi:hypothetical protein
MTDEERQLRHTCPVGSHAAGVFTAGCAACAAERREKNRATCLHEHTRRVQTVSDRFPRYHLCDDCHGQLAACAECGEPIKLSGGIGTGRPYQEHVHTQRYNPFPFHPGLGRSGESRMGLTKAAVYADQRLTFTDAPRSGPFAFYVEEYSEPLTEDQIAFFRDRMPVDPDRLISTDGYWNRRHKVVPFRRTR